MAPHCTVWYSRRSSIRLRGFRLCQLCLILSLLLLCNNLKPDTPVSPDETKTDSNPCGWDTRPLLGSFFLTVSFWEGKKKHWHGFMSSTGVMTWQNSLCFDSSTPRGSKVGTGFFDVNNWVACLLLLQAPSCGLTSWRSWTRRTGWIQSCWCTQWHSSIRSVDQLAPLEYEKEKNLFAWGVDTREAALFPKTANQMCRAVVYLRKFKVSNSSCMCWLYVHVSASLPHKNSVTFLYFSTVWP